MDFRPLIHLGWLLAGGLALTVLVVGLHRRGKRDIVGHRARRGTGRALLGLQEFVTPSVEFVFQAENAEQKSVDEGDALALDHEALRADLAQGLARDPVDHEEVRRHLAAARRAGLDWRFLFEQAVREELTARPYRAPALPPIWRVAPGEE